MAVPDRHKFILGIDYGTTYTGVTFVTSDKNGLDDINVVMSWPGPGKPTEGTWKTPTRIAYANENATIQTKENKWGFEVEPSMISYSWTKLLLDSSTAKGTHDDPTLTQYVGKGLMTLPSNRDAQGVCEDFLREIYRYIMAKLEKQYTPETVSITPREVWLTMPAIWSDAAQNATRDAALQAGFASRTFDSLNMISEPEAAAIATLKQDMSSDSLNPVKVGEDVLICDCGGGTVDITTYTIMATKPVLEFDELLIGVGGKCGATYIDRNLHVLLSKRFGSAFDSLTRKKKGPGSGFMDSFERIKYDFGYSEDGEERQIGPLMMKGVKDSDYYDEDESMVRLSHRDIQSLFDPVVNQIVSLVSEQAAAAKEMGHTIDRIILVGGFGDSPYVNKVLKKWCDKQGGIRLMCPQHCQAAISRGAALRGLEGTAPGQKQCRRHYGFPASIRFRPGIDDEENSFIDDFSQLKLVNGIMHWQIGKGEAVTEDTVKSLELNSSWSPGDHMQLRSGLFCSSHDVAPERVDHESIILVGMIQVAFSRDDIEQFDSVWRDGKKIYLLEFKLRTQYGARQGVLRFSSWVNGKEVGSTKINYMKNTRG